MGELHRLFVHDNSRPGRPRAISNLIRTVVFSFQYGRQSRPSRCSKRCQKMEKMRRVSIYMGREHDKKGKSTMSRMVEMLTNGGHHFWQAVKPGSPESRVRARTHIRRRLALAYLRRSRKEITFKRNGFIWTGSPSCTITRAIFIDGRHQDLYIPIHWINGYSPTGR